VLDLAGIYKGSLYEPFFLKKQHINTYKPKQVLGNLLLEYLCSVDSKTHKIFSNKRIFNYFIDSVKFYSEERMDNKIMRMSSRDLPIKK